MRQMVTQDEEPRPTDTARPRFTLVVGPSPFSMPRGWEFFLTAPYEGATFIGHWLKKKAGKSCATKRDGTKYWGRLVITFDDQTKNFAGLWSYCDAKPKGKWSGSR